MSVYIYNITNVKQSNYAGVANPARSKAGVSGYTASSTNTTFQLRESVEAPSGSPNEIIIKMDTYTLVPNSTEKLLDGNIILTDESKLKEYKWKVQAVTGFRNAYKIYQDKGGVNYLWSLDDSQDGTNIKLHPQFSDKDAVKAQYWIFEVAQFNA